ncbi:HEAT repeat domain-containing protein [Rasiella rasia]|uniref:HEAT repeat domain-containing protein n=1 Tax=Rasiella rasia TaxID=2744027 RepID=A0A6G6GI28_9FLAO|nr:HEAT repeat domain-containing protein [Rasiella rasia]QIE58160.1 HEAT repeat domain-containing protein [Rasiella rasia]
MAFYDLTKEERAKKTADIQFELLHALKNKTLEPYEHYFNDEDIYIRKVTYLGVGRIYNAETSLRLPIISFLKKLATHQSELVRQTVVNAAGEIGMFQFEAVQPFFDQALNDSHHKVRNAVIGSLKKMSQKNPKPVLIWAAKYIEHPEKEIRREVCHGIELRGRTHPEDVLPLLAKLQFEETKRVRDTLVHVLGQISYKKDCLPKLISALQQWKDMQLVKDSLLEIIDVHSEKRYAKFTALTQREVVAYISKSFPNKIL